MRLVASLVSERVQRQRLTPWKPNLAVVVDAIQFVRLICAMSVPSHKRSLRPRPSREDSPCSGLSAFEQEIFRESDRPAYGSTGGPGRGARPGGAGIGSPVGFPALRDSALA